MSDTVPPDLFQPVARAGVSDAMVEQIEGLILHGVLREGQRLPAERDLAAQFGVSRPKVHEALADLAERGLVRIDAKVGAFVAPLVFTALSPALVDLYTRYPDATYDHLEYRREQERFAARLAASRAAPADHERLRAIVRLMEATGEGEAFDAELDCRFHAAIAEASHNRTLLHLNASIAELNRRSLVLNRAVVAASASRKAALLEQHRALCEAICARDEEAAAAQAAAHVDYVIETVRTALESEQRAETSRQRQALEG